MSVVLRNSLRVGAIVFSAACFGSEPRSVAGTPSKIDVRASEQYGRLPVVFETTAGQASPGFEYMARGKGYSLGLSREGAVLSVNKRVPAALRMNIRGAQKGTTGEPLGPQASYSNYFVGNDARQWRTRVPHYGRVRYRSVYSRIDVVYHGTGGLLEYDFVVAPGGDPHLIALEFSGVPATQAKNGDLVFLLPDGELRQHKPVAYQENGGSGRSLIEAEYTKLAENRYGFKLGTYDRTRPVVIDPAISYSTYLGGASNDTPAGIAVDATGSAYVVGNTNSANFPVAGLPYRSIPAGSQDIYVAKLNATGTALVYTTYIGGPTEDSAAAIAVDANGSAYITGVAGSATFPTTPNAYRTAFMATTPHAYVLKLNAAGSALSYSTLIAPNTTPMGIAVDPSGNAYVTGSTFTTLFPTTNMAYKTALTGYSDGFVTAVNATGSGLVYSTLLGGTNSDYMNAITVDRSGQATVVGSTYSLDYPTTVSAYQRVPNTLTDAVITRLDANGTTLVASTLIGGNNGDSSSSVAIDASGVYVGILTSSSNFPTTPGAAQTATSGAALVKFDPLLTSLIYSTTVGAGNSGNCYSGKCEPYVALDAAGVLYAAGNTSSSSFSSTAGALQPGLSPSYSNQEAYLVQLKSDGTTFSYATTLGGDSSEIVYGISIDGLGRVYLTGSTTSVNFPVSRNAAQEYNASPLYSSYYGSPYTQYSDAFITRITMDSTSCSVTAGPGTIVIPAGFGAATVNVTAPDGCPWSAAVRSDYSYSSSWLAVSDGYGGLGNGTITVAYTANNSTTARTGSVLVSGQTLSVRQNGASCSYSIAPLSTDFAALGGMSDIVVTAPSGCSWTAASNASWLVALSYSTASNPGNGPGSARYMVLPNSGAARTGTITIAGQTFTVTQAGPGSVTPPPAGALQFIAATPCRIADTRTNALTIPAGGTLQVNLPFCAVPPSVKAYSLNVTVVPKGALPYLTIYPTGTSRPLASTLNSLDGRIKANAAIVPAGTNGSITVYAEGATDVVLDMNGYFVSASETTAGLAFYPLSPCRLGDTRDASSPISFTGVVSAAARTLNVLGAGCNVPGTAAAYSLNFTVVPLAPLSYLSTWPTGSSMPLVSTLNALEGQVTANAAIVPAGTGGAVDLYAAGTTHVVVDINGYFAPAGSTGAMNYYALTPCRVADTRASPWTPTLAGARDFGVSSSNCNVASAARAFALNATVVPKGGLNYLTLYPAGSSRPVVSTLNSLDGSVVANGAIVPTNNGSITAYATDATELVLDINGYFAP